ncbi:MAG: thiamine phosphate synthase [bacterium]
MEPGVYLISPREQPFLDQVPELLEVGFEYFQYRRPALTDRERWQELNHLVPLLEDASPDLIINNRPDFALAAEADGVHLGQSDLPAAPVKRNWPTITVGRTHRADEDLIEEADYYGVGPVFSPFSKTVDVEPCGWGGIRKVLGRTEKDVFAIGGLNQSRLEDVPAGLAGICVIGAVWDDASPVEALRGLRESLNETCV